jgi:hypothetical protein
MPFGLVKMRGNNNKRQATCLMLKQQQAASHLSYVETITSDKPLVVKSEKTENGNYQFSVFF